MKKEKYKVSILVAAYNIEKYIEKCIKSIINQTYHNLEIIIVDDCSKDNTGEICNILAEKDARIIYIHHETNTRLPGVRNTGLDNATGDFVVFVDGDDWLAPDFVEYLLNIIVETKSDMAISCTNFTTRDLVQTQEDYVEIWSPEKATADFLYSRIPIGAWDKMYRRTFIEKYHIRFHPELFTAEGFRFINDCAQRVNQVAVGHRRIYYYRLNNPTSATTLPDVRQGIGALFALDGIEKDLILRTEDIYASLHHHRWANHVYTLRIITENKSKLKERDLYRKCLKYIHSNGISVAKESKTKRHALRILATSIVPVLMCKYEIWKKNRVFKKDIESHRLEVR
ncbi:MAG: glycosyltransferase family 2 protein [Clostridium sp.]|nr:glycosyltransferase family 2 protein [Clostridium sp.]